MNAIIKAIAHSLPRLIFLAALALIPATQPASASAPRQAAATCQPNFPRLGGITGTVRDGEAQPLQGVIVTAYSTATGAPFPAGVSDAAGAYSNAHLPNGTYLLEFTPPPGPLRQIWYPNAAVPLAATPVEVKPNATTSGIDVTISAGVQFDLTLRDPEGQAVSQGQITIFDRYGRPVAGGWSDEAGRVLTTPGLAPDSYRLFARPPYDSPLLAHYHNQRPTLDAAEPITASQPGKLELALTMPLGARLGGTVTEAASGAPLAGISVVVRGAGTVGTGIYTTTDEQGNYSVAGLPSGSYQVTFSSTKAEPGAHAPLRRLITLSAPNARSDVDAALVPGGALRGRVTAPDGSPLADVRVSLRDSGAIELSSYSAADGTYAFYGLPSGRYSLSFAHDAHQAHASAEQATVDAPATTALATTVLSPGGAISGKVTGPDGKPLANVTVRVLDGASGERVVAEAPTNADGVYTTTATLASGSYIVRFEPPSSDGSCHLAIEYSGNAATAAEAGRVEVSAPNSQSAVDAKLEYGGLISGQIRDAVSGLPLSGTVRVYDAGGALVTTGTSSTLGHYRTAVALPTGAYRVQFLVPGYVSMFYGGARILEAAAAVPAGASEVSIGLTRGGTLTGRVTAGDTGAPLEYAAVSLYAANGRVVETQLTDYDGRYRFEGGLPSGTYRVGVEAGRREDGEPYFTGYLAVYSGGARSLEQAQQLSLEAPKTLEVNLAMPRATPAPKPPGSTHSIYLPLTRR